MRLNGRSARYVGRARSGLLRSRDRSIDPAACRSRRRCPVSFFESERSPRSRDSTDGSFQIRGKSVDQQPLLLRLLGRVGQTGVSRPYLEARVRSAASPFAFLAPGWLCNTLHLRSHNNDDSPGSIQTAGRLALGGSQRVVAHLPFDAAWVDAIPAGHHSLLENLVEERLMKCFLLARGE